MVFLFTSAKFHLTISLFAYVVTNRNLNVYFNCRQRNCLWLFLRIPLHTFYTGIFHALFTWSHKIMMKFQQISWNFQCYWCTHLILYSFRMFLTNYIDFFSILVQYFIVELINDERYTPLCTGENSMAVYKIKWIVFLFSNVSCFSI